jgi:serine/threonine-protein kinase PpkA
MTLETVQAKSLSEPVYQIPGYELGVKIGQGGMASVYVAVQRSLDRKVAIKIMRQIGDSSEEKRFLNEGRTMARLPHPNIVGVFDISQIDGLSYIAMEYLDGGSLSERMKDGLTLSEAIAVVVQIADALQFAHDNGVVHRDLKPGNILFRGKKTPVLTDFGIARVSGPDAVRLTQTGMMIGTPTYMSPEQAQAGPVDGRTDQYSLGVMFYELLARKILFDFETPMQVAYAHVNTPPPRLPDRVAFAQPILDRMLAKRPDDRYPDLKHFARDLRSLLTANDSLQQRLSVDPGHSVSERLRALGFSDAQMETGPTAVPAIRAPAHVPPVVLANQLLENSNLKLEPIKDDWRRRTAASSVEVGPKPIPIWIRHAGAGLVLLVLAAVVWELLRKQI